MATPQLYIYTTGLPHPTVPRPLQVKEGALQI